jgi:hypothetical protein
LGTYKYNFIVLLSLSSTILDDQSGASAPDDHPPPPDPAFVPTSNPGVGNKDIHQLGNLVASLTSSIDRLTAVMNQGEVPLSSLRAPSSSATPPTVASGSTPETDEGTYHPPLASSETRWYWVTRGRDVGVFRGW